MQMHIAVEHFTLRHYINEPFIGGTSAPAYPFLPQSAHFGSQRFLIAIIIMHILSPAAIYHFLNFFLEIRHILFGYLKNFEMQL